MGQRVFWDVGTGAATPHARAPAVTQASPPSGTCDTHALPCIVGFSASSVHLHVNESRTP
jgi:hypothetical protein